MSSNCLLSDSLRTLNRGLNRDLGDYVTTDSWSSLFTMINRKKGMPTFESMTANGTGTQDNTGAQENSDTGAEQNRSQSSIVTRSRSRNRTSSTNNNNNNQLTSITLINYAN